MNGARKHTRRGGRRHSRTGCRGIVARFSASKPQLIFEVVGGSNKGHVYSFDSVCSRYRGAREAIVAPCLRFLRYLPRQAMRPASRGRGGCWDTCSKHRRGSSAS
ncbi:hypothetical protein M9H77_18690 [Catharanthus roseus]|uniref:Uncharacterized protein n=1 Tax=Catharanthus roseus TaxID=4058 RepID=A0ACC0B843_CATRO|nr:hypothetical protein M9H77_18690 [Catharanthus roseus]